MSEPDGRCLRCGQKAKVQDIAFESDQVRVAIDCFDCRVGWVDVYDYSDRDEEVEL